MGIILTQFTNLALLQFLSQDSSICQGATQLSNVHLLQSVQPGVKFLGYVHLEPKKGEN